MTSSVRVISLTVCGADAFWMFCMLLAGYQHVQLYDFQGSGSVGGPMGTGGVPAAGGRVMKFNGFHKNIMALGFQEDGSWMFTAGEDGIVRVWEIRYYYTCTHADTPQHDTLYYITVHRQAKFLQTQFCACNPLDSTDMSLNVQNWLISTSFVETETPSTQFCGIP